VFLVCAFVLLVSLPSFPFPNHGLVGLYVMCVLCVLASIFTGPFETVDVSGGKEAYIECVAVRTRSY